MSLTFVMIVLYAVPFAAMFALNTPRRLAVGALLALLAVAAHFFIGRNASGDAGLTVFVFGAVVLLGLASGAVARLVLFALRRRSESRALTAGIGLLFLVGVPLILQLWGLAQQRASQRRYAPASLACKMRLHDAQLGDRVVRLPLAWGITVGDGRGVKGSSSFYTQEKAREFCERTESGKPRITLVRIDLPQLDAEHDSRQPICKTPRREAWWPVLCRHERPKQTDLYSIVLVDPARFDSERYLSFKVEAAGPDRMRYDARWRKDGPFMRIGSGYEIYLRGPARPGAASPYVAHCYEDRGDQDRPDGLRCKAGYRLSRGVGLVYDFRVDGDEFAAEALRQDERVFAVARSLLAP